MSSIDAAVLREVVDGVHAWVQPDGTWWVNNAGAVVGDGEVFVVDTCATEKLRRYYQLVLEIAATARGLTPLEAARAADLGEFAAWADSERLVLNLHRAYTENGGPEFDLVGALTDAVAYRGAPMATQV